MSEPLSAEAIALARRELAHELRNALGAIRSATELLQRRYQPKERDLRLFQVILQEVDRLNELVGKPSV